MTSADLKHNVRELYWRTPFLQHLYADSAVAAGQCARLFGNDYAALEQICNGARRVLSPAKKLELLGKLSAMVRVTCDGISPTLNRNPFLKSFLESNSAAETRRWLKQLSADERTTIRDNVILLKAPAGKERGVLLVQYTKYFHHFLVNFDLSKIQDRYMIALEPSWATYPEPYWALYSSESTPVVTQIISDEAVTATERAGLAIKGIAMGSQDWIDPHAFHPLAGTTKDFDVVMIANFARFKRHNVLFRTMKRIKSHRIKVAIIGGTWERTRQDFDQEMREHGVFDDCTVFQGLNAVQVNEVLNRSKVNMLLSRIEGGNRGLMEGWAANVPCIVYRDIIGPRKSDINERTGILSDDDELPDAITYMLDNYQRFKPRDWFLETTGCYRSTVRLNDTLRNIALGKGEPWTRDIVAKANRNEMQFCDQSDAENLAPAIQDLKKALAPL